MWSTVADQGKSSASRPGGPPRRDRARRDLEDGVGERLGVRPAAPTAGAVDQRLAAPPTSAVTTGVSLASASSTASPKVSPGHRERHVGPGEVPGFRLGRRRGRGTGPAPRGRSPRARRGAARSPGRPSAPAPSRRCEARPRSRPRGAALLPGQPSRVHQPQRAAWGRGAPPGVEGLQVDASGTRCSGVRPHAASGANSPSANPEVTTTASNRRTSTRLSTARRLHPGLPAGPQRDHRVEPLVGEEQRAHPVAPGPAGHGEQRRLVRHLDRGGPEPLEDVDHPPGSRISR